MEGKGDPVEEVSDGLLEMQLRLRPATSARRISRIARPDEAKRKPEGPPFASWALAEGPGAGKASSPP